MASRNDERFLKKKINHLIEKNQQLDDQIRTVEIEEEVLKEEIKMLNSQLDLETAKIMQNGESRMILFIKDFTKIAKQMVDEKRYIPYTYETKYSGDFYKIEKNDYEELICQNASMDLKCFLQFCADLQIVKKEKGKIFFSSAGIKVYYVSRAFVEKAIKG